LCEGVNKGEYVLGLPYLYKGVNNWVRQRRDVAASILGLAGFLAVKGRIWLLFQTVGPRLMQHRCRPRTKSESWLELVTYHDWMRHHGKGVQSQPVEVVPPARVHVGPEAPAPPGFEGVAEGCRDGS